MKSLYDCPVCGHRPYYETQGKRSVYRCCELYADGKDDAGARDTWNARVVSWSTSAHLTAWRVAGFLLALVVVLAAILALAMFFPSAVISP